MSKTLGRWNPLRPTVNGDVREYAGEWLQWTATFGRTGSTDKGGVRMLVFNVKDDYGREIRDHMWIPYTHVPGLAEGDTVAFLGLVRQLHNKKDYRINKTKNFRKCNAGARKRRQERRVKDRKRGLVIAVVGV